MNSSINLLTFSLTAKESLLDNRNKFELIQDFMTVLITSKVEEDPIKNGREKLATPF